MNDNQSNRQDSFPQWSQQPPTAPVSWENDTSFQVLPDQLTPTPLTQGSVVKSGPKVGRFGLAAALVVTAGLGGFAVRSALTEPAGPASPQEAFEGFFAAAANEDLVAMVEMMPPSEREAFVDPSVAVLQELQRLEILDPDANPNALDGVDITIEGLTYAQQDLDPRMAVFTTTGGTISFGDTTVGELPIGGLITDRITDSENWDQTIEGDSDDLGTTPISLAVIEEDGGWYVSITYSVAEAIRRETGEPFPGRGNGPAPVGGDTPEDAVRRFVAASVALDARGVIAQLDPKEMGALYDYSPLFLDDLDAVLSDVPSDFEMGVDRLDLRSWEQNGRTVVGIDGFAGHYRATDEWSGDSMTASVDFDGDCMTYAVDFLNDDYMDEGDSICQSDVDEMMANEGLVMPMLPSTGDSGITVVERDGRWYLSLYPSMMYGVADGLAEIQRSDIDAVIDGFESMVGSFFGLSPAENFGMIDEAINGGFDDEAYAEEPPVGEEMPTTTMLGQIGEGIYANYVVVAPIPAGTPAEMLLEAGLVQLVEVPEAELDYDSVWDITVELSGLIAQRDLAPGETLMLEDFDSAE